MQKKPLVSIVISTHNNKNTIKHCISSINKQTYKKIETIIVDEWSEDGTANLVSALGVKVFFFGKERANNRNFGIEKAHGDFLFICDSDMELTPKVIYECVEICLKNGYDAVVIPERSIGIGYWAKVRSFERQFTTGENVKGDNSVEAARFFSKKIFKEIGGYDPKIVGAEDWDLHQRIIKNGYKVARVKNFLYHNEGKLSLKRLINKKIYYGSAFLEYKKRYPDAFNKSIIRTSLLKNFYRFIFNPYYGIGVIVLKLLEGISLFYGMYLAQTNRRYKHY